MPELVPVNPSGPVSTTVAGYSDNLGSFRSQLLDWLNRTDISVAQANTIIARAVARCSRELRIPEMEKTVTLTVTPNSDGTTPKIDRMTLPDDFIQVKHLTVDGYPCSPVSYEKITVLPMDPGRGSVFAREQNTLVFRPLIKNYVTLIYVSAFAQMVNDGDTSSILTISPECLMFAALSYAGDFFRMQDATTWEQRFQLEKATLNQLAQDKDTLAIPQQVAGVGHGYADY